MEETSETEQAIVPHEGLERIKQRLQEWRTHRKSGERIPVPLWAAAVEVAKKLGVYQVAIELRLDYAGLKRRVEGTGAPAPRGKVTPRFVELVAAAASPTPAAETGRHECVVELENARGVKMRLELNGPGVAALTGLCNSFWAT